MKRIPLLCFALLSSAGVRAEWLTLTGTPGDAASSYVQVDPAAIEVDGSHRIVALRMNMQTDRLNRDGVRFRSFQARAMVDCDARSARYVSASYFAQPNFVGDPVLVKQFEEGDVRPVTLPGAPPELAARTVNAACAVRPKQAPRPEGAGESLPR
ncbi:surface-adhesin E family protein [Variovorax sp.]|uniref:surface-adhesin E family protein n=1 Tax=Variovorax sp. TaxID=1871043 RepID=UPI003BA84645